MRARICIASVLALCSTAAVFATIFGSVRGIVHDSQHRPIHGATITLKAKLSDWKQTQSTNDDGEFVFNAVPIGDYSVTVAADGFQNVEQNISVSSGSAPVLHFPMALATATQSVSVTAEPVTATPDSVTPTTVVNREDIQMTPGADRTNSLAMITDYVPGAYFTHDQLHVRGGHQVSWLVDGVPVPNTNIASNVGPQFDPKDVDYMEMQRGSYDAEYGDRTYGVFNVLPRTGFERNNQCELVTSFGSFLRSEEHTSCGGHTERFAYYGSLSGKRSNLRVQPPTPEVLHDAENGFGGFGSLIYNVDPKDQLRFIVSSRRDYYQIPDSPGVINELYGVPGAIFLTPYPPGTYFQADGEQEADTFVNFSWVRTITA